MKQRRQQRSTRRAKARAADVLGASTSQPRVPPKWQKHYKRLIELRDHFLHHKGDLAKDASEERPTFSMHMGDAGTDEYDRDFALSMMSSEQDALYEIEQALNRIQNGAYGICELTGKRIERERLAAIPWTRFSASAEKQLESRGEVARARLGPRKEVQRERIAEPPEDETE